MEKSNKALFLGIAIVTAAVYLMYSHRKKTKEQVEETDDLKRMDALRKLLLTPFYPHLDDLKSRLSNPGDMCYPSNEENLYTGARERPYNYSDRGYPLLIIKANDVNDVAEVVKFVKQYGDVWNMECGGRRNDVIFCVECGGHSNRCMLSDSLVLDLQNMNHVQVNIENHTVSVGGGAYIRDIDDALRPLNLAIPLGSYPLVGVGGLVLAGGYGWLSRKHGLSVDNLIEVEAVLVDGTVVIANDQNEYADLIFGFRGGGGNFGIVTNFTFRVHEIPEKVLAGTKNFLAPTLTSASMIVNNFDQLTSTLPNDVCAAMIFPGGASVVQTVWIYSGTEYKKAQDVPEFEEASKLGDWLTVENTVRPMSYHSEFQKITQQFHQPGFVITSLLQVGHIMVQLPQDALKDLLEFTRRPLAKTLDRSIAFLTFMGGAVIELTDTENKTCLDADMRSGRYWTLLECHWKPEAGAAGAADARAWVYTCKQILRKYPTNVLTNKSFLNKTAVIKHAPTSLDDLENVAKVTAPTIVRVNCQV